MDFQVALSFDEDGIFIAECLNLPGCISQGKTRKEALRNIKDAIRGYLKSLKKHREAVPIKRFSEIMAVRA
ncbi:MAG: type II toxin-antitoxin system HicB family antitoxin [Candidatus Micrarchaeota archaeon]|nr:type II toxin-antitoxin system HicB family antitoxin [Candidatus Micrarchaeota archaeon]